ncbi:MAG: phage tail sheath family protein [Chloroflexi bacterium]|nr:phage tail sheath family protein [Chloroflexota bacterium]
MVAAPGFTTKAAYVAIRDHCDSLKDRVGILDGPPTLGDAEIMQMSGENIANATWEMPDPSENGQLTLYTPWLIVSNPDPDPNGDMPTINVPPSGHIAGIWARTDATRGVHKAPANESVRGAVGLERQITHEEQGGMNANGVNCIRNFTRDGILVWGARTLTNEPTFRYLNVRRLFNMIEESIAEGTRWIVFEPNDRPLWQAIRRDLTAFLMGYWRDGALMGSTPEEAFFVKCDEETNPIESINEGRVVIEVGLAPVKPAEFVIFRISQYEAGTDVEIS